MVRYTGVVALATAAGLLAGSSSGAGPGPTTMSTAELPRTIPGGVELALADGDLFRVWTSDESGGVLSRRRDAATGTWGASAVVFDQEDVTCTAVDARTARGAVAVVADCRRYPRGAEQASPSVRALWSSDTVTWSSYAFDTEGMEEPAISPDGQSAVWPQVGKYVTYTDAGFEKDTVDRERLGTNLTATITDVGRVSYFYGEEADDGSCTLVVLDRAGGVTLGLQEIPLAQACAGDNMRSVDVDTVLLGEDSTPAERTVVSRPDAASPWAITEVAPRHAPGLAPGDRGFSTSFFTAPGLPLFALGSRDRHVVRSQVYDPTTQRWGRPRLAYDAGRGRCRWAGASYAEPLGVVLAELVCGGRRVVLTTRDDGTWTALRGGTQPVAPSADGRYVAVPGRSSTFVVSPEMGVVTLPGSVTGPCDLVVPDGPDGAVLLTAAGRHRGWPTILEHSTRNGWARLSRTTVEIPPSRCRTVQTELPYFFTLRGKGVDAFTARIVKRGSRWKALLRRW